jgi:hypothetical protein
MKLRDLALVLAVAAIAIALWVAWTNWADRDIEHYCATQGKTCTRY